MTQRYSAAAMAILSVLLLSACATSSNPPTVNGRNRVSVNATLEGSIAYAFPASATPIPLTLPAELPASRTVRVHFPWNVWAFQPSPREAAEIHSILRDGFVRISVRGRTDALRPSAGDREVAARRAAAARDWLIHQGVPAELISVNFASAADPIAGNNYSGGRALNRRVDIEIIRK